MTTSTSRTTSTGINVWRQRVGYGISDLSCNLVWQVITLYLMFYYTDVAGLSAAAVGVLFLVTRVVDGFTDVGMGIVIDKTHTRWGKSRPWILIGAFPFAIFASAAFFMPDLPTGGKLVYAYITYIGLSLAYTMVNIPIASILPSLTRSAQERTNLATSRIIFSFIGATAVSTLTMPMVGALGGGSQAKGFFLTMSTFGLIAIALFATSFLNVRELKHEESSRAISLREAFVSLKSNTYWHIFAVNILFMWGSFFLQTGALIYYFTYNLERTDLVSVIAGISTLVPLGGTLVTPLVARIMTKRTIYMVSSSILIAGLVLIVLAGATIPVLLAGAAIAAFGFGLRQSIYFSMQADPIDYGEWKSGVGAAGLLCSINGFIGKVAMAVTGALAGFLLDLSGYVPNGDQPASALLAIKGNYLLIPIVMNLISMAIMAFYKLDKIYPQIRKELDERLKTNDGES
ncbi:MFS transporter [Coraliomargarita parva]|uniref:MFS transporter n=1 Tax=Coraliomargarita parva TaxID=3014050 RepID=UPI0022B57447|nr:MFS transporter [Coraliomargarita parva]